jgi:DNA polymerase III sliding clamp (beta) subunit (PCNA family)
MKIECQVEKIKNALSTVERITGKNLTLPVLGSVLWVAKDTQEDQLLHFEQQIASMPLTSSGKIPLSQDNTTWSQSIYLFFPT